MTSTKLPKRWREKIAALRLAADEGRAVARDTQDRAGRVSRKIERLEARQHELSMTRAPMAQPGVDTAATIRKELSAIEDELKDAKRRLAALREIQRERTERAGADRSVVTAIERLL